MEALYLKTPEYRKKELKCYFQRREKVKNFKQERFILNLHYRNVTLRENGWMQVRLSQLSHLRDCPGLVVGSGWETMRVFSELARKECKGWKRVASFKDKKTNKNQLC